MSPALTLLESRHGQARLLSEGGSEVRVRLHSGTGNLLLESSVLPDALEVDDLLFSAYLLLRERFGRRADPSHPEEYPRLPYATALGVGERERESKLLTSSA